jgi:ferredoxin-NADP reductase
VTPTAAIADAHRTSSEVKQLRLVDDDHTFEYEPGQHTMVRFGNDGEEEARPDTAGNLPGGSEDELVPTTERSDDGNASVFVYGRTPGDGIEVEEVDGYLRPRDPERDPVSLVTGTGIAPLYPTLERCAGEGSGEVHLVRPAGPRPPDLVREPGPAPRGAR